jgi:hypothetical protein
MAGDHVATEIQFPEQSIEIGKYYFAVTLGVFFLIGS